ncbi:MAG: CoA transferase [Deltaproteobacteria bacterium]|nr:CoA transferase [Deltaproteobacteria bacterium]
MKKALEDVKVADFSWLLAGPLVTKYLADYGATVIRIESMKRPGIERTSPPQKEGRPGVNRAGYFAYFNPNKYSMALDLNRPKALDVAKRLIAWSDVVVENFAPGIMEKWGLGYEHLRELKPDIIMLRSSSQGQTGPFAKFATLGIPLVGLCGFSHFLGWPDREVLPFSMAYTDMISPRFAASALIGALDYRRRTGKGQCLDMSQLECGMQFLGPMVLNYAVNGRKGGRSGNSSPSAVPHGAYRCKGEERWCAIAVFTDQEWEAFCGVLNEPWTKDERFATFAGRKENEAELNKLTEGWTINYPAEEIVERLQGAGIAAGVVKNAEDIYNDPQLRARGFFWPAKHAELGDFTVFGQPAKLSKTPAELRMPPPLLGEHTEYVCTKILGIPDDEFVALYNSGIFS